MSKLKVFLTFFILFSIVFYFWKSPWSPIVEHKIQNRIVQSKVDEAIHLLEWRASFAFDDNKYQEDMWRAAQLSFIRSQDVQRSKRLLDTCLDIPFFQHTTQARMYLGYLAFEGDPYKGLQFWKDALAIDPKHEKASKMWVRIASEYELMGEKQEAIQAWNKALRYEDVENMAHLALGRLKLKSDPPSALEHFQIVKSDSFMERTRAAELGEKLAQWEIEKETP